MFLSLESVKTTQMLMFVHHNNVLMHKRATHTIPCMMLYFPGEKMMIFVAMIDISIVTKFTNTQLNGTERFIEQSQQHLGKHKRPETILTLLSSSSGDGQWTFET